MTGSDGCARARGKPGEPLRLTHLVPAGVPTELNRTIGYWEPYATSPDALDKDEAIHGDVTNAAK